VCKLTRRMRRRSDQKHGVEKLWFFVNNTQLCERSNESMTR
jgi:hypothetical protein